MIEGFIFHKPDIRPNKRISIKRLILGIIFHLMKLDTKNVSLLKVHTGKKRWWNKTPTGCHSDSKTKYGERKYHISLNKFPFRKFVSTFKESNYTRSVGKWCRSIIMHCLLLSDRMFPSADACRNIPIKHIESCSTFVTCS